MGIFQTPKRLAQRLLHGQPDAGVMPVPEHSPPCDAGNLLLANGVRVIGPMPLFFEKDIGSGRL